MSTTQQRATDEQTIRVLNDRFIAACAVGSWEMLRQVLSESFGYVDGETGEAWKHERYVASIRNDRSLELTIDQVVIRVASDVACVSARTSNGTGRHNRYVDIYAREDGGWACIQAMVWPTEPSR